MIKCAYKKENTDNLKCDFEMQHATDYTITTKTATKAG